ncbi:MAG: leucine-rich repeat domain-containing protein, partial [Ureaplasma sp.]|nr:leucine-rich repeat domain-containing protein [Ureaplasma sp.]
FNNLISTNKYTQSDLSSYINDSANAADVKKLVTDNLYVSDTIKLDSSQIGTISSNANGIVTINLVAPANIKYTAEENTNVTVSNNKITISNLKYYSEVRISSLSNTYNYFQKIITDNNYTSSNFRTYVTNNQSSFKTWFINNSSISVIGGDNQAFSSSDIASVALNSSDQLVFSLSNVSYRKYSIQSANNVTVSGNTITFESFSFYKSDNEWVPYFTWSGYTITGLSNLGTTVSTLYIPSNCRSINQDAFRNNNTIVSITIPKNVTSIGKWAFYNCSKLKNVYIDANISILDDNVFTSCKELTKVTLPEGLTTIGLDCFYNCWKLSSINIPSTLTTLVHGVFCNCVSLSSITLPASTTIIGEYTFQYWAYQNVTNNTSLPIIIYVKTQSQYNTLRQYFTGSIVYY